MAGHTRKYFELHGAKLCFVEFDPSPPLDPANNADRLYHSFAPTIKFLVVRKSALPGGGVGPIARLCEEIELGAHGLYADALRDLV